MLNVFAALAVIAAVGASLQYLVPSLDIDATRRKLGVLVLNVLLPALNISVLYDARLGQDVWQIPVAMLAGILAAVLAALLAYSFFRLDRKLKSSLILASAFGNVTYLGLPLLRGLFPDSVLEVTKIAILCEVTVSCTDLIAGCLLALYYQKPEAHVSIGAAAGRLLRFPVLWSVAIAVIIRALDIPLPPFLLTALRLMGETAPGLMLLVLGMAIKPPALVRSIAHVDIWWPAFLLKLGLSPLVVGLVGGWVGLSALDLHATTLEAAMPPQLFLFVVADRFGFDTEVLAAVVAIMTVLSFVTLPIVKYMLGAG